MLYKQAKDIGFGNNQEIDFNKLAYQNGKFTAKLNDKEIDYRVLGTSDISDSKIKKVLEYHRQNFLPAYGERLKQIISLTRSHGIEPIFITQPAVYGNAKDDVTGVNLSTMIIENSNGEWGKGQTGILKWEILELYNQVTRDVGRTEKIKVIDLANKMPKSTKFYYDFIHYDKMGSEKVADILYHELCLYFADKYPDYLIKSCLKDL